MRLLINLENTDDIREIYIDDGETLEKLKYIIEAELNIPYNQQVVKLYDKPLLNDSTNILLYDLKNDDILVISKSASNQQLNSNNINNNNNKLDFSKAFDDTMKMLNNNNQNSNLSNAGQGLFGNLFSLESKIKNEVKQLKDYYINNPDQMSVLFNTNPDLAELIVAGDDVKLGDYVKERIQSQDAAAKKKREEEELIKNADPNDPIVQKKVEEIKKWKDIDENMQMAYEHMPEVFYQIHMLFINLEIEKTKIVALVDTGAQMTIISEDLAKKCGIFRLCDTRRSGIAKGVGTSKILGVIHAAQMKIGDRYIMCKISVIENNDIGFIFGLDNMRSHRCSINLAKFTLDFPDAGISINFLSDGEIQKSKIDKEEEDIELELAKEAGILKNQDDKAIN